ncbi:MAG TPA: sialidase family protein [Acidimicrobiales bacterium]|nr:sialidase family protein [Acidimicrobiales bacterium]
MRRLVVATTVLALVALAALPASASGGSATPPVVASAAAPLATPPCSDTAGTGSALQPTPEVFADSEVEPWVDAFAGDLDGDGVMGDVVAGIWQQDRWSNGGSRDQRGAISFDDGATWQQIAFAGVTACTGGSFDRATDPWLSFSPDGDLHIMHLALDIEPPAGQAGGFGANAMLAQKIDAAAFGDGVITPAEISAPITLALDDTGNLHDKNSMTADPTDPDLAYAVWDFLTVPEGHQMNPERGVGNLVGFGFKSVTLFTRTTDGGASWSEPRIIYNPGGNNQTIGNQIVVSPDGTLYNFFDEILNFRNDDGGPQFDLNVSMKYSPDKGVTWLPAGRPVRIADLRSIPVIDPDQPTAPMARDRHRTGDILPDVAVDPTTGALYVTWMDARFSPGGSHNDIALTRSTDGGQTWSTPIRVNTTPDSATGANGNAFTPSVHVLPDGTVGVSYYDFRRNDPAGGGTDTDHWLVHCHASTEDCTLAANWNEEVRVTTGSFDARQAPVAGGFFLGDYVGLDDDGTHFTPFFAQALSAADPTDIFYAEVTP